MASPDAGRRVQGGVGIWATTTRCCSASAGSRRTRAFTCWLQRWRRCASHAASPAAERGSGCSSATAPTANGSNGDRAIRHLRDRVILTGRVDDPTLHAWYEAATLFVHPTLYEGSSLVTLEAMAHRRAVVATTAGGLPDKVRPGVNGWLVEPGRPDALAAAMSGALARSRPAASDGRGRAAASSNRNSPGRSSPAGTSRCTVSSWRSRCLQPLDRRRGSAATDRRDVCGRRVSQLLAVPRAADRRWDWRWRMRCGSAGRRCSSACAPTCRGSWCRGIR